MSTDAWIEEHWISEAILPRPRRAPKLPALPVPHAPTCSRGNAALAAHAQSRDSARHPGDRLSARQDGRNVADQQARKLTQPVTFKWKYYPAGSIESVTTVCSPMPIGPTILHWPASCSVYPTRPRRVARETAPKIVTKTPSGTPALAAAGV